MMVTVTIGNVRVGTLSRSGSIGRSLPHHERHKRLLRMQAILSLVPDGRTAPVEDFFGDLFAVMGRQTMQHDRLVARSGDEVGVDAVAREVSQPLLPLVLLSHGGPDVGGEHVRSFDRRARVVDELDGTAGPARDLDRLVTGAVGGGSR